MAFFKKALASIGIGAAKIDTIIESEKIVPGGELEGRVEIYGGNVEQNIDAIYLRLHTSYEKEVEDTTESVSVVIESYLIDDEITIEANETKIIPFTLELSPYTPLTKGKTKVWITTGLDIKNSIDPTDVDYLDVEPTPIVKELLTAIRDLGFKQKSVENKKSSYGLGGLPFVQEFEFAPISGPFRGKLDELECIITDLSNNSVTANLQIDRKARGLGGFLAEALELDESYVRVTFYKNDSVSIEDKLYQTIKQHC